MGQLHSIDCEQVRGHISAGLDGELSEVESARVEAHLGSCAACRDFSGGVRETANVLRAAPPEELDFAIVLPSRRLALARRIPVAAAAAMLAAAVGLGALVGGFGSSNNAGLRAARAASAGSASLRFPENELRMLQRASSARASTNGHSRLTL
jgi:predicted anti-sigma-YlaC factor YlaD